MVMRKTLPFLILSTLMLRSSLAMIVTHINCRNGVYPRSKIERFPVPDNKVPWSISYSGYNPPNYTDPVIYGKTWADPDTGLSEIKWNQYDNDVNRISYTGQYMVVNNFPLNIVGRTGICGRGVLGRWGPNHAADTIVTRWKPITSKNDKGILQFIAIKRRDTGEWAIPGGMVDPGETVIAAAIREFQEEAINSLDMSDDLKQVWRLQFEKFFLSGVQVYKGYVDDHRNTDNAWMETVAYNFHDEDGKIVEKFNLHAGDDAVGVRWVDITPDLKLYANHRKIIDETVNKLLHSLEDSRK